MRILPLVLLIKDKPLAERYRIAKEVSSVTHGHIRSVIACFYYLEFARLLLQKVEKFDAYKQLQTTITDFLNSESINPTEIDLYHRLLQGSIYELEEEEIFSSGYVLHTLEASIWCILTTDNYAAATLKAVNLGLDTDTTGAVTGGLAGLLYGYQSIPSEWLQVLAKRADIEQLGDLMQQQLEA
jgi:ADP-ribosyl-[dinitrogen reductase] hydrolase